MSGLGRREPTDWAHVEKYPLSAVAAPTRVPVAIGVNWYTNFDRPERDSQGNWWVGRGALGTVRGGHCVCLKAFDRTDLASWWSFYDQGNEGACVGFGCSRMMSELNRRRYDAPWLYQEAQKVDEYPDTPPAEGTSVRAGLDILRTVGHRRIMRGKARPADLAEGIAANRWTTSADDVARATGATGDFVVFVNSWGEGYPHETRMPLSVLQRLLNENGEASVVTDR